MLMLSVCIHYICVELTLDRGLLRVSQISHWFPMLASLAIGLPNATVKDTQNYLQGSGLTFVVHGRC